MLFFYIKDQVVASMTNCSIDMTNRLYSVHKISSNFDQCVIKQAQLSTYNCVFCTSEMQYRTRSVQYPYRKLMHCMIALKADCAIFDISAQQNV